MVNESKAFEENYKEGQRNEEQREYSETIEEGNWQPSLESGSRGRIFWLETKEQKLEEVCLTI